MKLSQTFIALACAAVLILLLGWGLFAIPKYLEFREQLAVVREQQRQDAEQVEQGQEPEFYQANPFFTSITPPPPPHPKLELKEELLHNFGEMFLGDTKTHEFRIHNAGAAPLKLVRGPVECKCTVGNVARDGIAPGETGVIKLEFNPVGEGRFLKHATFFTNDPARPALTLAVAGDVLGDLAITPLDGWTLGPLKPNSERVLEARIYSLQKADLKILGVETSSPERLSFTFEEDPLAKDTVQGIAAGFVIRGTLKVGEDPGAIDETVTVHTNYATRDTVVFKVSASVLGPLEIFSRNWDAANMRVRLGVVDSSREQKFPLMLLLEPESEEFRIVEYKSVPEFVQVDVRKEGEAGDRERHRLTLTIPAKTPPGDWTNRSEGEILLRTNHSKLPEIRLKLSLTIQ